MSIAFCRPIDPQADDQKDATEWVAEIDEVIKKINAEINVGVDDIALTRALEGRELEDDEVGTRSAFVHVC